MSALPLHITARLPAWRFVSLVVAVLAVFVAAAAPSAASAQGRFDVRFLHPAPSQSTSGVGLHGARLLQPGDWEAHLLGSFGWSPLALQNPDGSTLGKLVSSTTQIHLLGAVGLHERVDIGFDVPIIRNQAGDGITGFRDTGLTRDATGVGDIRLVPRVLLVSSFDPVDDASGFALTFVGDVRLPTGSQDDFAGDGGFRFDPRLAFESGFGRSHRLFVNAGYTIRPEARVAGALEIDDFIAFGAGLDLRALRAFHIFGELDAGLTPSDVFGSDEVSVELRGGVRLPIQSVLIQLGGRGGLSGGATVPDWGMLASLGVRSNRADRLAARDRRAAAEAEQDLVDPCAEPSRQGTAACPDDPAPVEDRDGDGVPDSEDGCPDVSGIDLGCPADADGDGLPDAEDACPDLAEDSDGFDDDDGCPELDNDNDGFEDTEDRCPDEGGLDEGCPLEVSLTLYFETDSSELSSEAREALEHWASSLMSASVEPAMFSAATLTIVGHTDATGEAAYNEQLSRQRALSVASVLRELGFDIETVDSTGVGAAEPAAMGSDERSLSRNRRVELQLSLPTVDAVPETP